MDSPNHVCPMNCGSLPESVKRTTGSSSQSHRLRSGCVGGCQNCVLLEGMLEAERKARRKACRNATEAREKCLHMGTTLFKIAQVLQEANEHLRSIEAHVEAAIDLNSTEPYVPHVIRID
ncbi:RNA ligase/cyclic nucleotide phosphodiesterase [Trema orientale]|uniref:RNA ligase/cyclic nucleotide phosphodiesterase n=1 Tax=Trema orientale TaxID=63057 RepID=A0A2P5FST3_TREOI|nr:RNA ligase/cyclic nucleotide phosphodiesterase [Trema orientale]